MKKSILPLIFAGILQGCASFGSIVNSPKIEDCFSEIESTEKDKKYGYYLEYNSKSYKDNSVGPLEINGKRGFKILLGNREGYDALSVLSKDIEDSFDSQLNNYFNLIDYDMIKKENLATRAILFGHENDLYLFFADAESKETHLYKIYNSKSCCNRTYKIGDFEIDFSKNNRDILSNISKKKEYPQVPFYTDVIENNTQSIEQILSTISK